MSGGKTSAAEWRENYVRALCDAVPCVMADVHRITIAYLSRRFVDWDPVNIGNADASHWILFDTATPPQPFDQKTAAGHNAFRVAVSRGTRPALSSPVVSAVFVEADRGVSMTYDQGTRWTIVYGQSTIALSGLTRWAVRLAACPPFTWQALGVTAKALPLRAGEAVSVTDGFSVVFNTHYAIYHSIGASDVDCKVEPLSEGGGADLDGWACQKLGPNEVDCGFVYTFDADLHANTLRMQIHRPHYRSFPAANSAFARPSPVLAMRLPARLKLADMRPIIGLFGPRVVVVDTEPGDVFPRQTGDD